MPLTASKLGLMDSVFMKEGAKVPDAGVPVLESFRPCLDIGKDGMLPASVDWDRVLLCEGGVGGEGITEGEEMIVDFGLGAGLEA